MRSSNKIKGRVTSASVAPDIFAWILFGLSIGLMLSDYMSRLVLIGVFPMLKLEWGLRDSELGLLSGVVPVMVGVLVLPLSSAADRFGRVKSIVAMALLWSLATAACGLSTSYGQMLIARIFVGVGEAAYASVGVAVLFGLFPLDRRATINGAFMASAFLGSILGIAVGAYIAASFGWRQAFLAMACLGVILALAYWEVARRTPIEAGASNRSQIGISGDTFRSLRGKLLSTPTLVFAYVGSGLQLFVASAFIAWMPSYLQRAYDIDLAKAGSATAICILLSGLGMVSCSLLADHAGRRSRLNKLFLAIAYCLLCFVAFTAAFLFPRGLSQLAFLGCGMFFVAGPSGVAGAVIANCTDAAIHASALAALVLANNLLGLAPAPMVTGLIADHFGLPLALQLVPLASLGAAAAFLVCARHYQIDQTIGSI